MKLLITTLTIVFISFAAIAKETSYKCGTQWFTVAEYKSVNMKALMAWSASLPGTIALFYIIMSFYSYHETGEFYSVLSLIITLSFSLILFIYFKMKKKRMIDNYDKALIDFIGTISKPSPKKS